MGSPSAEVKTLADKIYWGHDQAEIKMAAQTLIALVPTFSAEDKAYVLSQMNYCMGSSNPKWKQEIAMSVIVATRHFA
jgi:hypothetical protein